jgi:arabinose-5-phosphate isomerase
MGKAGLVAQKIAATLASTGTTSHFVHPAEAVHGDLGRIAARDLVLMFSQSGESAEIRQILPSLAHIGTAIVAVTCRGTSTLARAARVTIDLGPIDEACPLGLAPTTSTTAMLAVGDALALVVSRMRGLTREDFARFHPGGSLGRRLSRVEEAMRPLEKCRVAKETDTVRQVFVERQQPGRRSGAIMLEDASGRLTGIFTDSDLARLFETMREAELDRPIADLMTRGPKTIPAGAMLTDAVRLMAASKISELPVVDANGKPLGMVDITDLVGLEPDEFTQVEYASPSDDSPPQATLPFAPRSAPFAADGANPDLGRTRT